MNLTRSAIATVTAPSVGMDAVEAEPETWTSKAMPVQDARAWAARASAVLQARGALWTLTLIREIEASPNTTEVGS